MENAFPQYSPSTDCLLQLMQDLEDAQRVQCEIKDELPLVLRFNLRETAKTHLRFEESMTEPEAEALRQRQRVT